MICYSYWFKLLYDYFGWRSLVVPWFATWSPHIIRHSGLAIDCQRHNFSCASTHVTQILQPIVRITETKHITMCSHIPGFIDSMFFFSEPTLKQSSVHDRTICLSVINDIDVRSATIVFQKNCCSIFCPSLSTLNEEQLQNHDYQPVLILKTNTYLL